MSATRTDRWGVPLQSASQEGAAHFDDAVEGLLSMSGDPLAAVEEAVAADPELILGHVVRAYISLYSTSAEGVRTAAKILEPLKGTDLNLGEREVLHLRAARSWAEGQWDDATHWLERALLHDSQDLLALKVAQDLYFFLGESKEIHGVVARVIRAWPADKRGWGYIQGMLAFGLEETGDCEQAEIFARAALHHNPLDTWATHALAHVFEMEGRPKEGVRFLNESVASWSSSFFAIHNWWHLCLFHLALGEIDEVLAHYDGPIRGSGSREWLDIVDAASLLWRLSLFGIDVSDRVARLANDIEPLLGDPTYIFNDWHAVMVFGLAGHSELSEQLINNNRRRSVGTNRLVAEQVGLGLLEGFTSFSTGRFERTIDQLSDVRGRANVVGGSHAQRDIVELTLIAAAARAGANSGARALVAERAARKPGTAAAAARLLNANSRSA
jgi:tetratricopeptide (TPR) repeat protein